MRTTSDSINLTSTPGDTNFGLQFNLPATDLIWLLQDETRTNGNVQNNDWFNFGLGDGSAATDFFTSAVLKINNVNREEARGPLYFRVSTTFTTLSFQLWLQLLILFFSISIELPFTKDPHRFTKQLHVRVPIFCK